MSLILSESVPLAPYTTLKVGGNARYFVTVHDEGELRAAVRLARDKCLSYWIMGAGSNTLVPDAGYPGIVVLMKIKGYSVEEQGEERRVTTGAGENFDEIVEKTVAEGWWGLENLSRIPGTMGAFPIQNVGAYGVEAKDVIDSVRVYDSECDVFTTLSNEACEFSYRDSLFKQPRGSHFIVTAVTLRLSKTPTPKLSYGPLQNYPELDTPQKIRALITHIRAEKFPDWNTVGTAGSFFKNPTVPLAVGDRLRREFPLLPTYPVSHNTLKIALGFVLDQICGLRGYTRGTVRLYEKQALVLVAELGATEGDINELVTHVTKVVREKIGVTIEEEVRRMK